MRQVACELLVKSERFRILDPEYLDRRVRESGGGVDSKPSELASVGRKNGFEIEFVLWGTLRALRVETAVNEYSGWKVRPGVISSSPDRPWALPRWVARGKGAARSLPSILPPR